MRLLLVEDDARTAQFVNKGLTHAGFSVDLTCDGEEGLPMAQATPYDVAVIDIMLPRLDVLTLIEQLRRQKITLPIIVLSAKKTVDDRIRGLQIGGDDYLVKPFCFFRTTGPHSDPSVLQPGQRGSDQTGGRRSQSRYRQTQGDPRRQRDRPAAA